MLTKTFAIALLLTSPTIAAQPREMTPLDERLTSDGFERLDREHGVVVYQDPESPIIRIAAEGIFAASPEDVFRMLLDYEGQAGAVQRVVETRILASGVGWLRVYQRLELPVISDRDYTLQVTWGAENDDLWIAFSAVRSGPAPREGIVRVSNNQGSWQLRPVKGGQMTLVRFQTHLDLAGSLPRWMAHSDGSDELPEMFQNMRMLVKRQTEEGVR